MKEANCGHTRNSAYFYFYTLVRSTYIKRFPLAKLTTA